MAIEIKKIPLTQELPAAFGDGRGVYISTYGCQMNENDSERMISLLEMVNFYPVPVPEQASLILINSCSVREKPVHKVLSEVGKYRKLKENNHLLRIGVGGCVAQQEKGQLMKDAPLVDFVFGTDAIETLPELVKKTYEVKPNKKGKIREKYMSTRFDYKTAYHAETLVREPGISTFVNITKGCDNFCTFCVVPYTRGRERSRPYSMLIDDINKLISRGVKEVTLLGQNVNSYKSECGKDFADLMEGVARDTSIERIRYMTSHPKDFNQKLVDISAQYLSKVGNYVHLPVQSGNTELLERMNRGYSREDYFEKVEMLRDKIPNLALSTDLIVGFPGETDEQFEDTLSMMREIQYDAIFAYKYSPRPFTKAARYEDQVDEDVKKSRLDKLFKLHEEISFSVAKQYEDKVLSVLVEKEGKTSGKMIGRSLENKVVHFLGHKDLKGKTVQVKINTAFPQTFRGELV